MSNAYTRLNLKMSKKEKVVLIGLIALLVGYGIYQTSYGYTIGQNGTMYVPGMPGTYITAPPGSTAGGVKIIQEPNGYSVDASDITIPYSNQTR